MKNKVLVLGGSGFLGNHVINALLLNDYKVCSVDLNPSKISHKNFDFISLNLSENIQELSRYSEDFNYVINFAGISDLDYCHENPKESLEFNIQSNIDILDIFKNSKKLKKYIYASSAYASGSSGSFYAIAKKTSESIIKEYSENYNLNYTILRYGSLYGIGSDSRNSIYRFLKSALNESKINYSGTGDEVREFINVKDAADLTIESLNKKYDNNI